MEGQGLREGKNAMLHLKRVASGMTPLSAKGKKGKTVLGWKAGRPSFLGVDRLGLKVCMPSACRIQVRSRGQMRQAVKNWR
jgi:hypothetical protein